MNRLIQLLKDNNLDDEFNKGVNLLRVFSNGIEFKRGEPVFFKLNNVADFNNKIEFINKIRIDGNNIQ